MQTVFVAGGAGFIGSNLCEKLLSQGYFVVCIDNLLTSSKKNIEPLLSNPNFQFVEQDVIHVELSDFDKLPKPDFIFHLASPASPNSNSKTSYMAFPLETMMVNTLGTYKLLEVATKYNARFLFASTSEVYGDPEVSPQSEEYVGCVNPNGIRSVYDEGKRAGEAIVMAFVRKFNVDARIIRIFNTYGPNMQPDDGRVVSNFIVQALRGEPLTIYGDGSQTRSFGYVSDLVEGMYLLMFTDGLQGEVVNIGNPIEKTIKEFATIVKEITGTSSEIVYNELPSDDPRQRKPDINKAKKLLDWEPKVTLEDGLKKTIAYFRKVLEDSKRG